MKKSTLIVSLAVIGSFATLTAANLKLKKEYSKGSIQSAFVQTTLPSFSYIKTLFDSTSTNTSIFEVTVSKSMNHSVSSYYRDQGKFLFAVIKDTLFIKNDPLDKTRFTQTNSFAINTPQLNTVTVTKGRFNIHQMGTDSLSVVASGETKIGIRLDHAIPKITILGSDKAFISLSSKEMIGEADIHLSDKSTFSANDVLIKEKKVQFSNSASLQLSGRSLENFGVRKN